jgi:hypothetical protein
MRCSARMRIPDDSLVLGIPARWSRPRRKDRDRRNSWPRPRKSRKYVKIFGEVGRTMVFESKRINKEFQKRN